MPKKRRKIVVVKSRAKVPSPLLSKVPLEAWKPVQDFFETCRNLQFRLDLSRVHPRDRKAARKRLRPVSFREFLGQEYLRLFNSEAPKNVNVELLKNAIGYELQYQGFAKAGCVHLLSPEFLSRRKASCFLNLNAYRSDDDMRLLTKLAMQSENRTMPSGKKVSTRKSEPEKRDGRRKGITLGLSRHRTWVHLFKTYGSAWNGARYRAFMEKEFPGYPPSKHANVQKYVRRYNAGGLQGQESAPSKQVKVEGAESKSTGKVAPKKAVVKPAKKSAVKVRRVVKKVVAPVPADVDLEPEKEE